jgi:ATP-dependent Clp protease ATP-binding subunit ClpC
MKEYLSVSAREIYQRSQWEAFRLGNNSLEAEHIVLAMIRQGGSVAVEFIKSAGVELEKLCERMEFLSQVKPEQPATDGMEIPISICAKKAITLAYLETKVSNHTSIEIDDLFLAILRSTENGIEPMFCKYGITYESFRYFVENKKSKAIL